LNLLDINVLLALADEGHEFHDAAWRWFPSARRDGWATCPLTENGFVRILGHPGHPSGLGSVAAARNVLESLCGAAGHSFWPDHLSLRNRRQFPQLDAAGAKTLTDLYLLALAGAKNGRFVTFDRRIPAKMVTGGAKALHVLTP